MADKWAQRQGMLSGDDYNIIENATNVFDSGTTDKLRLNLAHRTVVAIRKGYDSSYTDTYDYTYGGTYNELQDWRKVAADALYAGLLGGGRNGGVSRVKSVRQIANENKAFRDRMINGCNCFVGDTKVLTEDGEKNIEDIQIGDKVLAKNDETGAVEYKEVTDTFHHDTDEIYNINVGGQTIQATFNHPFYVKNKGWIFVKDLKVGDLLLQSDGNTLKIDSVEREDKYTTVYNMTVADFHTYFVSDLGIWVHNSNCKLSSPNPVPGAIRTQYEEINLGGGTPRIDPKTGQQTIFSANELRQGASNNVWAGSLEWDVPGTRHRILQRPDGKLGYVLNHDYSKPKLFPGPWYPDGASR